MEASDRLPDDVLLGAGHKLYLAEYAGEFESLRRETKRPDLKMPPNIACLNPILLIPIMRGFEEELSLAWGSPPAKVFFFMGLKSVADVTQALYLTLMDCAGYDICIFDQFAERVGVYEDIVGEELDIDPFTADFSDLARFARCNLKILTSDKSEKKRKIAG